MGKYNEFDQLRVSGVQHADIKGYQFSREDVDARSLANLYARYMGNVFTHEMKPLEVEILVAEVGPIPVRTRSSTSSTTARWSTKTVSRPWGARRKPSPAAWRGPTGLDWPLAEALTASVHALRGAERPLTPHELEVAVLDRGNGRRAFRRVFEAEVTQLLSTEPPPAPGPGGPAGTEGGAEGGAERSGPAPD